MKNTKTQLTLQIYLYLSNPPILSSNLVFERSILNISIQLYRLCNKCINFWKSVHCDWHKDENKNASLRRAKIFKNRTFRSKLRQFWEYDILDMNCGYKILVLKIYRWTSNISEPKASENFDFLLLLGQNFIESCASAVIKICIEISIIIAAKQRNFWKLSVFRQIYFIFS